MRPKQLVQVIKDLGHTKRPLFIWGPPGVGKTSLVRQVAEEAKESYMDVRCLLHDPSDLKFPIVDVQRQVVNWVNSIFPTGNYQGVVALEEIDKCSPMMQGALLQPVLERRIGDYQVPEGVRFVLIANRLEDKAGGHNIITPLRGRCIHLDLDTSVEDWNEWAIGAQIDSRVRMYILKVGGSEALFKFDPNQRSSPTPRSWEFASDVRRAYSSVRVGKEVAESEMYWPLAGCVGEGEAAKFLAYCKIADMIPDIDNDILAKPTTAPIPAKEPSLMYAICGAITDRTIKCDPKVMAAAVTYASRIPDDFSVMLISDMCVATKRKVLEIPEIIAWTKQHRHVFTS